MGVRPRLPEVALSECRVLCCRGGVAMNAQRLDRSGFTLRKGQAAGVGAAWAGGAAW